MQHGNKNLCELYLYAEYGNKNFCELYLYAGYANKNLYAGYANKNLRGRCLHNRPNYRRKNCPGTHPDKVRETNLHGLGNPAMRRHNY